MSSAVTPRPAGRPSTITPSERPCDSPAVRNLSTLNLGRLADLLDVAPQLGDETVHARESHLTADPRVERDLGLLTVEVAVEVEQVGLDQERAALGIEGGAAADRDRRHVVGALLAAIGARVDAVGRQLDVAGHRHVGRREAERSTPLVAVLDDAADRVAATEQPRRQPDVAGGDRLADERRGHAADAVDRHRADALDLEPSGPAHCLEQRQVAAAAVAEVEVLADHDGSGGEVAYEPVDEDGG